jgi:hypothetical protein
MYCSLFLIISNMPVKMMTPFKLEGVIILGNKWFTYCTVIDSTI